MNRPHVQLRSAKEKAIAFAQSGQALLSAGKSEQAIKKLKKALAVQPGLHQVHLLLGNALRNTGQH